MFIDVEVIPHKNAYIVRRKDNGMELFLQTDYDIATLAFDCGLIKAPLPKYLSDTDITDIDKVPDFYDELFECGQAKYFYIESRYDNNEVFVGYIDNIRKEDGEIIVNNHLTVPSCQIFNTLEDMINELINKDRKNRNNGGVRVNTIENYYDNLSE